MVDLNSHTGRLLDLYDKKSRDFQVYFAILISLSIFVLFFILIPYVGLQHAIIEKSNQYNETKNKLEDITLLHSIHDAIYSNQEKIQAVTNEVGYFVGNITRASINATSPMNQSLVQFTTFGQCSAYKSNMTHVQDCVRKKTNSVLTEFNKKLTVNVISPLQKLHNKSLVPEEYQDKLRKENQSIYESFAKTLNKSGEFWNFSNPHFFLLFGGAHESSDMVESATIFGNSTHYLIDSVLDKFGVKDNPDELKKLQHKLNNEIGNLTDEQDQLKDKLTKFETPIGTVAIGFNELIMAFPLVLAGGSLVCLSLLLDTMHFRKALLQFYSLDLKPSDTPEKSSNASNQSQLNNKNVLSERDKVVIAPLWIDLKNPEQHRKVRVLILLLPVILFSVSSILIVHSWTLGSSLGYNSSYQTVFGILYLILGPLIFGYTYSRILLELKRQLL